MEMSRTASPAHVAKRTKVRYAILLLIFLITTFNYADRATLSVTGSAMRATRRTPRRTRSIIATSSAAGSRARCCPASCASSSRRC